MVPPAPAQTMAEEDGDGPGSSAPSVSPGCGKEGQGRERPGGLGCGRPRLAAGGGVWRKAEGAERMGRSFVGGSGKPGWNFKLGIKWEKQKLQKLGEGERWLRGRAVSRSFMGWGT